LFPSHDHEKKGVFKGDKSPDALIDKAQAGVDNASSALKKVLKSADSARGKEKITPSFSNARDYISKLAGTDRKRAQLAFDREIKALADDLDGSLESLQQAKVAFNKKVYSAANLDKKSLNKAITRDLKEAIEDGVDDLAKKGKLDSKLEGSIRRLNKEEGDFLQMLPIFERELAGDLSGDIGKKLIQKARTSGGTFALPALLGAASGATGPGVVAGTALTALLNTKAGKMLVGNALQRGGNASQNLARLLSSPDAADTLTRLAVILGDEDAEKKTEFEPAPQIELGPQGETPAGIPSFGAPEPAPAATSQSASNFPYQLQDPSLQPLIESIIHVESRGNPRAVSPVGAQGLMQLMPEIQRAFNVTDPFDPQESVRGGEALLMEELGRFKDVKLALAAYNAGSPAINRAIKKAGSRDFERVKAHLPKETREYVPKVLAQLQQRSPDYAV
jgi:hypothetical protein